jgi:hypothetical protein
VSDVVENQKPNGHSTNQERQERNRDLAARLQARDSLTDVIDLLINAVNAFLDSVEFSQEPFLVACGHHEILYAIAKSVTVHEALVPMVSMVISIK